MKNTILGTLLTTLLLAGFVSPANSSAPSSPSATPTLPKSVRVTPHLNPQLRALLGPAATAGADKGDFKVVWGEVKNAKYRELQKELRDSKALDELAGELNQVFALPENIEITFSECNTDNAFYDPEEKRITMCYELMEHFDTIFAEEAETAADGEDASLNATIFVFFHEFGHALIDVLDLPVVGKEEDAVDQLSTILLADGTDEGDKMAIDGAQSFYLEDAEEGSEIDDTAFYDTHSLNLQRFYNIMCLVYGQNEEKYASLVKDGVLPRDRAEVCAAEYEHINSSWLRLLKPHVK